MYITKRPDLSFKKDHFIFIVHCIIYVQSYYDTNIKMAIVQTSYLVQLLSYGSSYWLPEKKSNKFCKNKYICTISAIDLLTNYF